MRQSACHCREVALVSNWNLVSWHLLFLALNLFPTLSKTRVPGASRTAKTL